MTAVGRRPRPRARSVRSRRSFFRLRLSILCIGFILSLFAARLFQLQGVDANAYASMAEDEGTQTVELHASRGAILDRNGFELASTVDAVALTADPTMTADNATRIAAILQRHLGLEYFSTVSQLRAPDTRFVYLARRVPTWKSNEVMSALDRANLVGVFTERDPLRTYPDGDASANLVGVVGAEGGGLSGLEYEYDDLLAGEDGHATYLLAPSGERIPLSDATVDDPEPGVGLQTTIDRDVQWMAERRLTRAVRDTGSDWGTAVTIDVRTGEVVQFSQYPGFDPNQVGSLDEDDMVNRGAQYVYEPGSVEKVLTYSAVADAGEVTPRTRIKVPGAYHVDGYEINDDWSHGTIRLTATGAIAKSSNLAAILVSQRISARELHGYLESFGLGERTGIGLPGESAGILADYRDWSDSQHATIAFGQGLSVTAIQMAAALATVANDGVYVEPTLVTGYVQPDGSVEPAPEPETHRVISEQAAEMVAKMMTATTQDGGTAPLAAIPGYRVAGKTGTAQRVDQDTLGYVPGQRTISFAGFAPSDDPRFLTYVVLDNPKDGSFGGTGAGPVFHDIMSMVLQRYGIAPTGAKPVRIPLEW
jgi:cell division protein FtsI (penicillin-binding protein 3)